MTSSLTEGLAQRLAAIEDRIRVAATASGRSDADVTLLAVSKRHSDDAVAELARLHVADFGENQIQAWRARRQRFDGPDLRWHLIGPLQSNKAKFVAADPPALVHTIDRPSVVDALVRRLDASPRPLDVLIQVNIDAEPQKSGCAVGDIDALADHVSAAAGLRLCGMMCLPRPAGLAALRDAFARTRRLMETVSDRVDGRPVLSMGTSGDFEAAIAEGSTLVRIGTALFGSR